jgi:hypothetical protein
MEFSDDRSTQDTMPPRHPLLACCRTADRPWICAHCGDAGVDTPTVFMIDEFSAMHSIIVPPEAVDDILEYLMHVTGINFYESRHFFSGTFEDDFNAASIMVVSVYCDDNGKQIHERNAGASQILGFEVYGKAIVVCSEEAKGTADVEEYFVDTGMKVWPIEPFLRELDARGKGVQTYKDKLIAHYGRVGDVLHKIKITCENDPRGGEGYYRW